MENIVLNGKSYVRFTPQEIDAYRLEKDIDEMQRLGYFKAKGSNMDRANESEQKHNGRFVV
jgi:hypothetical protein